MPPLNPIFSNYKLFYGSGKKYQSQQVIINLEILKVSPKFALLLKPFY